MKIKINDLSDCALDWAVANCEGYEIEILRTQEIMVRTFKPFERLWFHPSSYWAQAGPIIERERIQVWSSISSSDWGAANPGKGQNVHYLASTPLIAAMRCYVASKLGDEVEVPDGLT